MIELLAAIEPAAVPLLAVLAFALSLYPVGLMLGSPCSPCCGCSACLQGALPNTVTVTLSGMPDTRPGPDLLFVSINSCFGFGATAEARAPSGDADPGPITSLEVTNGGSGYATLGRIEPVVTAEGVGGVDAELTVTLTEDQDFCGLPFWAATAIGVTDGGSGYSLNSEIVFTPAEGHVEDQAASAQVSETDAGEPTLELSGPDGRGSGAEFTAVMNQVGFTPDPERWEISSVTVDEGGTGYFDGDQLTVDEVAGTIEESAAYMIIRTVRDTPVLTITPRNGSDLVVVMRTLDVSPALATWEIDEVTVNDGGSGYSDMEELAFNLGSNVRDQGFALLVARTVRSEPTLTATTSSGDGAVLTIAVTESGSPPVWSASSVTVTSPGSGYTNGDPWTITASSGTVVFNGSATATVDEFGGLVSLAIDNGGEFFFDTGEIDSVEVPFRGVFFEDTGVIQSIEIPFGGGSYYETTGAIVAVTISSGGEYYREDDSIPALVDDVTVEVFDSAPSNGAGATFEAVIDDDPDSATFGQITGITVTSGGDDYLEFKNLQVCCGDFYDGRPIVLTRIEPPSVDGEFRRPPDKCEYEHRFCGVGNAVGNRGSLRVKYFGPSVPPEVIIESEVPIGGLNSVSSDFFSATTCSFNDSSRFDFQPFGIEFGDSLVSSENVSDCGDFSFTATNEAGVSAEVSPGGDYDADDGYAGEDSCFICCQGTDEIQDEIAVQWTNNGSEVESGNYVLTRNTNLDSPNIRAWSGFTLGVRLRSCGTLSEDTRHFEPLVLPGGDECDECHRSCITFATITFVINDPQFDGFIFTDTSLAGDTPATCADCEETPLCGPTSGSYVIQDKGTLAF